LFLVSYLFNFYSIPDRGAEYCDERVCPYVSVCLSVRDHIFGTTCPIFINFFVHVNYGRGSVLLWRRSDTLRTSISGFMDDVIFAHKLQAEAARCRRQAGAVRLTQPWAWRVGIPVACSVRSRLLLAVRAY